MPCSYGYGRKQWNMDNWVAHSNDFVITMNKFIFYTDIINKGSFFLKKKKIEME